MKSQSQFTIETIDRTLFVDATGPFNEAVINNYQRELISSVEALSGAPWVMLLTLRDESLFLSDAETELIKVIKWRKDYGMTKVALMVGHIDASEALKSQMTRMYIAAEVEHAFFEDSDEALDWLKE